MCVIEASVTNRDDSTQSFAHHVSELEGEMLSLTIPIIGMTCGGCVNSVRSALSKVTGVQEAQVSVGTATVTYDPALTTPEAIREAIAHAGYTAAAA